MARFVGELDQAAMNMAERITCQVLMSVGLEDLVCPPRASFAPFNTVTSEKTYRVYPFAGHGTWQQHSDVKNAWMTKILYIDILCKV
jgi:cephalosporin-C deacetylase